MSHAFYRTAQGRGERRIPRSGDTQGRKSAFQGANGQAYAPSEVSGILFTKKSNILILFSEFVLQDKDNNQSNN